MLHQTVPKNNKKELFNLVTNADTTGPSIPLSHKDVLQIASPTLCRSIPALSECPTFPRNRNLKKKVQTVERDLKLSRV